MIRHLLAVLLLAGGLAAFSPAPAAHADNGCPGTRDSWVPYNDINGDYVATVESYDIAGSSTNCYALVSRGQYRGVSKYMELTICSSARTGCKTDAGKYATYAGPLNGPFCSYYAVVIKNPSGNTILHSTGYIGSCD